MRAQSGSAGLSTQTLVAVICGTGVALLGVIALLGWIIGAQALTTVLPGLASMKANAALCFVLSGTSLGLMQSSAAYARKGAGLCAALTAAVGLITVLEYATGWNPGLDQILVRQPANDWNPFPGRMAAATAIGFTLAGSALLLKLHSLRAAWARFPSELLTWAVLTIGAIATLGYLTDVEFFYSFYLFGTVALHTAAGLLVLGLGLVYALPALGEERTSEAESRRIARTATALLVLVSTASGLAGFAALQSQMRATVDESLLLAVEGRRNRLLTIFELRSASAAIVSTRPNLHKHLRLLAVEPEHADYRRTVQEILESFAPHGFTAITVNLPDGRVIARMGEFALAPTLQSELQVREPTWLLWQEGFRIRHRLPVMEGDTLLGVITTEQELPEVTAALDAEGRWKTIEFELCQPGSLVIRCYPTARSPAPYSVPAQASGVPLGERLTSAGVGYDDRHGRRVLAAAGHVGATGLIAIAKVDSAEIYQPIAARFALAVVLVIMLTALGTQWIRMRLRPLARALSLEVERKTHALEESNLRLAESEERFRLIVELAPSAMIAIDKSGAILLVNALAEHIFGYSRAELLGQPVEMLLPENLRAQHPGYRRSFFAQPQTRAMGAGRDLHARRKDGSQFPVEIGLNPIRTQETMFVLASVIDITERKNAEAKLRQSEERFRNMVEAAPNAMVMVGQDGRIALVNLQAEKMFGYTREELLGQPVEMLLPERMRATHPDHRHQFFANPETRAMGAGRDLYALRKDGSEFPVEIGLNPIQTETGTLVLSAIVDITERKRAEAILRHNEERFRGVVEAAPNAMVMVDSTGRIVLINTQTETMFGYPRGELVGQPVEVLIPIRFHAPHPGYRQAFFSAPQTRTMGAGRDLYGVRKDGSEFPVEIGLNPIQTETGTLVLSAIVDITERKRAETKLRQSEERFRNMVEAAPNAMVMVGRDGRIALVNLQAEEMFGYRREELLNQPVEMLLPERLRAQHPGHRRDFFANPEIRAMGAGRDLYSRRKDGSEFPVEIGLNPIVTEEGTMVLSAIVDITERKRLEEQRRAQQAQELLAAIVKDSDDSIITETLDGTITSWNAGAVTLFGYTSAEALGHSVVQLIPPGQANEEPEILARIARGEKVEQYETRRMRKDGQIVHVSLSVSPLRDASGTIVGASKIARDISERQRARQAIEAALQEKTVLLNEIHHRVKNNLQVISSLINLQSAQTAEPSAKAALADSQARIKAMALMHQLLYEHKEFSGAHLGEYLRRLAQLVQAAYQNLAGRVRLEVQTADLYLDLQRAIPCGLIVNELLSNAYKHAFPGDRSGTVRVELRDTGDGRALLTVGDDGAGLPPGFKLDDGPSLGLKLVELLSAQIGAELTLDSTLGTRFELRFALLAQDQHRPVTSADAAS